MLTNEALERRFSFLEDSNTTEYAYDNNGNLSSKILKSDNTKVTQFIHNTENHLIAIQEYNGTNVTNETKYFYDAIGRRTKKEHFNYTNSANSFSRKFQYDNQEILFELDGDNSLLSTFTHSGLRTDDVMAVDKSGTSYFYLKDHLGSVNDIVDGTGSLVQHYIYSPFGKIVKIENASGVDITSMPVVESFYTFTGKEFDKESGLYFYRARYYDSETGRFIQADPNSGKLTRPNTHINKFAYVENNSINRIDPSGMFSIGGAFRSFVSYAFFGPVGFLADVNFSGNYSAREKLTINKIAIAIGATAILLQSGGSSGDLLKITATSTASASITKGNFVDNLLNSYIASTLFTASLNYVWPPGDAKQIADVPEDELLFGHVVEPRDVFEGSVGYFMAAYTIDDSLRSKTLQRRWDRIW